MIAQTPEPPYVAVVFTSLRTDGDHGYAAMAAAMDRLAAQQPGYLGAESARAESGRADNARADNASDATAPGDAEGLGITVSYWRDEESARAWKQVAAHLVAQRRGREQWYRDYRVRVAVVTRDYGPGNAAPVMRPRNLVPAATRRARAGTRTARPGPGLADRPC